VFCNQGGFTMAAALVINAALQPGVYRAKAFQLFQRLFSLHVLK
jgi:hypothetical protein